MRYPIFLFPALAWLSLVGSVFASANAHGSQCDSGMLFRVGHAPIILTAPHGAKQTQRLLGVPDRENPEQLKGFNVLADNYTQEITENLARYLKAKGLSVYVLIAAVHRSQIDFNRPAYRAYEQPLAQPCYKRYHEYIADTVNNIRQQWGNGLLIDIHGQSRYDYDIIRGTVNGKTIAALRQRYNDDVTEKEHGLFFSLRKQGYRFHPKPFTKERYYPGGFTVRQYGSHQPKGIDAIQLEIGRAIRFDKRKRQQLVVDLGDAILAFYKHYYSERPLE